MTPSRATPTAGDAGGNKFRFPVCTSHSTINRLAGIAIGPSAKRSGVAGIVILCGLFYLVGPMDRMGWKALPRPNEAAATETTATKTASKMTAAPTYSAPRHLTDLRIAPLWESSGLAVSLREIDVFWTHNDSGDRPRLFAFNRDGQHLGTCQIESAAAIDWEDMASFERDGIAYLLVGDIGNNTCANRAAHLYLIREPRSDARETELLWSAEFRYDEGPQDGEALGVDAVSGTILVANKRWTGTTEVYSLPLPDASPRQPLEARRIATVSVPTVTAMDVAPDGLKIVMATYGNAFEFTRNENEDWEAALKRPGREIELPPRKQGETICYGRSGKSLYLTSEKQPTPLFELLEQ